MSEQSLRENYERVLEQIACSAQRTGCSARQVKLVVVTKGHPLSAIEEALASGVRVFGENYAEEGVEKILASSMQTGVEWHMIGHVQSRKARLVCKHFQWLHSLDSWKLAQRLDRFAADLGARLPVLLECIVSGEESKFGWPTWQEQDWSSWLPEFRRIAELPNLQVRGLMTMAPFLPDPEQARPFFQRLRRFQEFLAQHLDTENWQELSMGMSADFEVAVEEGATLVRIGTAIMGSRKQ